MPRDLFGAKTIAIFIMLVILSSACSSSRQFTRIAPFTKDLRAWPEMYAQNFKKMTTFSGAARLTVESPGYNGTISMETSWIDSDNLHILAEGPLGLDVGKIYIGKDRFIVYNQYDNYFTAGSLDDPYLNRFLQTSITLKELRYATVGMSIHWADDLQLIDTTNAIYLHHTDELDYQYMVNPASGLLERLDISRDDRVFITQTFKNYRIIKGVYVPTIVQITLPEEAERISIFYENIDLNMPLDREKYTIQVKTKVQQLNLN